MCGCDYLVDDNLLDVCASPLYHHSIDIFRTTVSYVCVRVGFTRKETLMYVYGAVRRLRSSLVRIDGLMHSYFAGFELDAILSVPSCPSSKRLPVVEGSTLGKLAVVFSNRDDTVTCEHPVNRLVTSLKFCGDSTRATPSWRSRARRVIQ